MKKRHLIVVIAVALAAALASTACAPATPTQPQQPEPAPAPAFPKTGTPTADVTELKVEDVTVGTGAEAKTGSNVSVHYTGWLTDGTEFDSSADGAPIEFVLGSGRVIQGWEQGLVGMKVGGVRRLVIPPALAYGDQSPGEPIPPNATLVFEVQLVGIQ